MIRNGNFSFAKFVSKKKLLNRLRTQATDSIKFFRVCSSSSAGFTVKPAEEKKSCGLDYGLYKTHTSWLWNKRHKVFVQTFHQLGLLSVEMKVLAFIIHIHIEKLLWRQLAEKRLIVVIEFSLGFFFAGVRISSSATVKGCIYFLFQFSPSHAATSSSSFGSHLRLFPPKEL